MKARSSAIKFIGVLLLAALTLMFCFPVLASSGNTTLTTSVPTHFSLEIDIQGKGTVTVNSTEFAESSTIQIERNSVALLRVLPDDGYCIKSVIYNGENITDKVVNATLSLPITESNSQLSATFVANAATPETGDTDFNTIEAGSIITVLSLICLITLLVRQKKRTNDY